MQPKSFRLPIDPYPPPPPATPHDLKANDVYPEWTVDPYPSNQHAEENKQRLEPPIDRYTIVGNKGFENTSYPFTSLHPGVMERVPQKEVEFESSTLFPEDIITSLLSPEIQKEEFQFSTPSPHRANPRKAGYCEDAKFGLHNLLRFGAKLERQSKCEVYFCTKIDKRVHLVK